MKAFQKDKKKIKKWAKPFRVLLASEKLMKKLTKLMGRQLIKSGKFPLAIKEGETVASKYSDMQHTIKFQLKKVTCLATAVGRADHTPEQLCQNLTISINFLIGLLKKGWHNIKTLHIKTTMSPSYCIYG